MRHKTIIGRAVWAATGTGVLIGPGVDAAPLIAIWAAGFLAIADAEGIEFNKETSKAFVATLFAGFVNWYVSGEIAQMVIAFLAGAGGALTIGTLGLGAAVAAVAYLGSNALINALFTYKFLKATSNAFSGATGREAALSDSLRQMIMRQLFDLDDLGSDIVKMVRAMF